MDVTTLLLAIAITVIVFIATKASKLNTLIQAVLSLIAFMVSITIYSQWEHNPLVATVMFVVIALMVNLVLILSISKCLPTLETHFRTRPTKFYLSLALAMLVLVVYIVFIVAVGLLSDSVSYPIAVMHMTGGFTIIVGILSLLKRVYFRKA